MTSSFIDDDTMIDYPVRLVIEVDLTANSDKSMFDIPAHPEDIDPNRVAELKSEITKVLEKGTDGITVSVSDIRLFFGG